MTVSIEGRASS